MSAAVWQPGSCKEIRVNIDRDSPASSTVAEFYGYVVFLKHIDPDELEISECITDSSAMMSAAAKHKSLVFEGACTMPAKQAREEVAFSRIRLRKTKAQRGAALQS